MNVKKLLSLLNNKAIKSFLFIFVIIICFSALEMYARYKFWDGSFRERAFILGEKSIHQKSIHRIE